MLDAVIQYVEAVLDGTEEPDNSVGRALNDMVSYIRLGTIELCQSLSFTFIEVTLVSGAISAQDGPWPIWGDVEQQHEGPADGRLPFPNDQDSAAVEWEALHGLGQ